MNLLHLKQCIQIYYETLQEIIRFSRFYGDFKFVLYDKIISSEREIIITATNETAVRSCLKAADKNV